MIKCTYLSLLSSFVSGAATFRATFGSEARVLASAAQNQEDENYYRAYDTPDDSDENKNV